MVFCLVCGTSRSVGKKSVFQERYLVGEEDSRGSSDIESLESEADVHVEEVAANPFSSGGSHSALYVCMYVCVQLERLAR